MLYFFQKLEKMLQDLSSAAVVIFFYLPASAYLLVNFGLGISSLVIYHCGL